MRLDEYTPDAVCGAMGLRAFRDLLEAEGCELWIRLLLEPSFHPEVCITVCLRASVGMLEVRTFDGQLWHVETAAAHPAVFVEKVVVESSIVEDIALGMRRVAEKVRSEGKRWVVICDGTPSIATCRLKNREWIDLKLNVPESPAFASWVDGVAERVYRSILPGHCRNAIAVITNLPKDALPKSPPVTRLLLLGDEDEKRQVADLLSKERQRPTSHTDSSEIP